MSLSLLFGLYYTVIPSLIYAMLAKHSIYYYHCYYHCYSIRKISPFKQIGPHKDFY